MKVMLLACYFAVLFISCSGKLDEEPDTDIVPPVVTVATPFNSQVFNNGDAIRITGNVSDNTIVADIQLLVTNNNTGQQYVNVHLYPGTASAPFDQTITAASTTNYKIQVIAKDQRANRTTTTLAASCN